jgi:hypothetical protein
MNRQILVVLLASLMGCGMAVSAIAQSALDRLDRQIRQRSQTDRSSHSSDTQPPSLTANREASAGRTKSAYLGLLADILRSAVPGQKIRFDLLREDNRLQIPVGATEQPAGPLRQPAAQFPEVVPLPPGEPVAAAPEPENGPRLSAPRQDPPGVGESRIERLERRIAEMERRVADLERALADVQKVDKPGRKR